MIFTSIRAALYAAFIALMPSLAPAAPHSLPVSSPIFEVTLPDGWKTTKDELSVGAVSPDGGLYVQYMLVSNKEFEMAMLTWESWAARQLIILHEKGKSVKKFKFEGQDSISHRWHATDSSGPTIVMRTILKLSEEKLMFVTEWGSEPVTQKYASELRAIRQSVEKLK